MFKINHLVLYTGYPRTEKTGNCLTRKDFFWKILRGLYRKTQGMLSGGVVGGGGGRILISNRGEISILTGKNQGKYREFCVSNSVDTLSFIFIFRLNTNYVVFLTV